MLQTYNGKHLHATEDAVETDLLVLMVDECILERGGEGIQAGIIRRIALNAFMPQDVANGL